MRVLKPDISFHFINDDVGDRAFDSTLSMLKMNVAAFYCYMIWQPKFLSFILFFIKQQLELLSKDKAEVREEVDPCFFFFRKAI